MRPKTLFPPFAETLHLDSGNTRSKDVMGPLGNNLTLATWTTPKSPFFWDSKGRLLSIALCDTVICIAALDPITLETRATWAAPDQQNLQITYIQEREGSLVVPTEEGRVYHVDRVDEANGTTTFHVSRDVDVSSVVPSSQKLLGTAWDQNGNIWFATGGIVGFDVATANDTVVGYITPTNTVYHITIVNQVAENNMAVTGNTVYMSTGPAGTDDHPSAVGYLFGFSASSSGVRTVFNETYQAGDSFKAGAFARGSGSSPGLVGNEYIAITDNANSRINLLVYRQVGAGYASDQVSTSTETSQNLVCKLALFSPNASANDNALVTHFDGEKHSIVVTNSFNQPPMLNLANGLPADINNSTWNNLTGMPGEFAKIDISPNGSCSVAWTVTEFHQTSIPLLSTGAGLLYTYAQDSDLAREGKYVWYWVAIDHATGREVWRSRAGAGGTYNNNGMLPVLGPDGALWIATVAGTLRVADGV